MKELISFAVTAKLVCVFCFAYADCWFSHEAAQMSLIEKKNIYQTSLMSLRLFMISAFIHLFICSFISSKLGFLKFIIHILGIL